MSTRRELAEIRRMAAMDPLAYATVATNGDLLQALRNYSWTLRALLTAVETGALCGPESDETGPAGMAIPGEPL